MGSTLVLALMPLGVLSVVQTQSAQNDMLASTLEGVAGASLKAVQQQIDLINDARISARVMAAALPVALSERGSCSDRAKAVNDDLPSATLVAYLPMSGLMSCSSTGAVHDFSSSPHFRNAISRPEPMVMYNPHGAVSDTAVVAVTHPVFDRQGAQIGIVSISLPYFSVAPQAYADPVALWRPVYLATIRGDGTLLIGSDPGRDLDSALPPGVTAASLAERAGRSALLRDEGASRILSVTSVAPDLYLLSIWQRESAGIFSPASWVAPYLLPVLTWLAALVAASFAASRLVVRHVRALSRSMSDYMATRSRIMVPDITDAPAEIQNLHAVYEQLIRTIEHEEAELQNLIVDKDVLLREVNHRSGNSLQIIASVMRMYRRESRDDEVRTILDGLINRVIALSSTHSSLYTMTGRRDVPMDEILAGVVRRLKEIHGVALGVARKHFDPVRMPVEAAVPLAMALAEIIGCHFHARSVASEGVDISFREDDGEISLKVEGPIVPEFLPETMSGIAALPRRMLLQFAAQLRGKVAIRSADNRSAVEVTFPHIAV
ncbi:sensor histidine kinase [Tabrizicola sp.]|uniref:sensor histidine kinase n=1 Tax=Tabrizicola sp. TaxID=2005166 RepID=UPI0035AF3B0A